MGIIGVGKNYAVASKGGMGIEGEFLWKLKVKIDVDWMAGYQILPEMSVMVNANAVERPSVLMGSDALALIAHAKMRCGGCGSKVGSQVLSRVLARIKSLIFTDRAEIVAGVATGTGDDCALVVPPPPPAQLVHTIDYFRSFISDPYIFGQIAANHSLSDIFAMNGEPVSALALCVVPYGPEEKVEDLLVQYMAGVLRVLSAERCALVGGHTSEGAEASLGLSVTGSVLPQNVLRKGPPRVLRTAASLIDNNSDNQDVIILTKPLGTGCILAADMRAKARGAWVIEAVRSMLQSNASAAKILFAHECSACTDVTGFGLLGHLIEMLQCPVPVDVQERLVPAASLFVKEIPLLLGAAECIEAGIMSTLHPQNIRCSRVVDGITDAVGMPAYPLLYDPQTSGGLLATLPRRNAAAAITSLKAAGYEHATIIGEVYALDTNDEFAALVTLKC